MHPMIASLLRQEAYDHPVQEPIELLETHISWILLTGPFAYKIKKPVDLGFVNFSTAARRRRCCEEELRLNRRLAPDLYLDLATIHGPAERARFHGDGEPIDVAVRMHQFPQQALLPAVLARGGTTEAHWADLADRLAAFHGAAAVAPAAQPFGSAEAVWGPAEANLDVLQHGGALRHCVLTDGVAASDALVALRRWTEAEHGRLLAFFEDRRAAGRIRECHGDLHLGNMLFDHSRIELGRIEVFDCLEFSPPLRWIDVISDMAFLAMDLQQRGQPQIAAGVLNRWLEATGDYAGMVGWRWYVIYRALVRAKVSALRLAQADLTAAEAAPLRAQLGSYLGLAHASCDPAAGVLLITHGVSGSGKTHHARRLCARLGWIHLRSDVERKRWFGRWGIPPQACLAGDPYRREVSERLYSERLPACAEAVLAAGFSLVVDATFLHREQRDRLRSVAERCGARFVILDCVCPEALAERRIERRLRNGKDPSDADATVLRDQLLAGEPLTEEERAVAVQAGSLLDSEMEGSGDEVLEPLITTLLGPAGAGSDG
jgi:uncharacterized protein